MISSSASVKDGIMTVTLANCSLDEDAELCGDIVGFDGKSVEATILKGEVHQYNTFDEPENIKAEAYTADLRDGKLTVKLPASSVVQLTIR